MRDNDEEAAIIEQNLLAHESIRRTGLQSEAFQVELQISHLSEAAVEIHYAQPDTLVEQQHGLVLLMACRAFYDV